MEEPRLAHGYGYIQAQHSDILRHLNVLECALSIDHSYNMMMSQAVALQRAIRKDTRWIRKPDGEPIFGVSDTVAHLTTRVISDIHRYVEHLNHWRVALHDKQRDGSITAPKQQMQKDDNEDLEALDAFRNYVEHSRVVLPLCYIIAKRKSQPQGKPHTDLHIIIDHLGAAGLRLWTPRDELLLSLPSSTNDQQIAHYNLGQTLENTVSGFHRDYGQLAKSLTSRTEQSISYLNDHKEPVAQDKSQAVNSIVEHHIAEDAQRQVLAKKNSKLHPNR